jgi:uncharacterized protein (TIGR03085 family)
MTAPATQERAALAGLLSELGPEQPTLCQGWDTRMLAAHLVTRESRFTAVAGILIPRFAAHTAALERETAEKLEFGELVHRVASGPPLGRTLVGLPLLEAPANLHEFFVHHEDVRRAQATWVPRDLPPQLVTGLWRRLLLLAPALFPGMRGVRLHLVSDDGRRHSVGRGADEVTITGPVPELFLYAFGRLSAARVRVHGTPAGESRLAGVDLRK